MGSQMSKSGRRPPVTPKTPPPRGRARLSRRGIGIAAAAIVVLIAAAWFAFLRPHRAMSAGGVDLGALPRGGNAGDLNVLLITLDTTRADHLGLYGDKTAATPNLDRLGRDGIVFDQAGTTGARATAAA